MQELSLSEQKKIQLNILKYVDSVCKENDIKYFVSDGTLLGAIRHKGFIPWDDDIDIALARPEYERLLSILKTDNKYTLLTPDTIGYFHMFSKVVDKRTILITDDAREQAIPNLGVNIDLFPIDGVPDSYEAQVSFYSEVVSMLRGVYMAASYSQKNSQNVILEEMKMRLLKKMQTYDFNDYTHAGCLVSPYGIRAILPKQIFEGQIEVEFEGEKFCTIKEYKLYLTSLYGDYMKLPPVEKRHSHHLNYEAYWKAD